MPSFANPYTGSRSPAESVGDNKPIGIFSADRLDQTLYDAHINVFRDIAPGSLRRSKLTRSFGKPLYRLAKCAQ